MGKGLAPERIFSAAKSPPGKPQTQNHKQGERKGGAVKKQKENGEGEERKPPALELTCTRPDLASQRRSRTRSENSGRVLEMEERVINTTTFHDDGEEEEEEEETLYHHLYVSNGVIRRGSR